MNLSIFPVSICDPGLGLSKIERKPLNMDSSVVVLNLNARYPPYLTSRWPLPGSKNIWKQCWKVGKGGEGWE